jgi:hypothetical protein
MLVQSPGAAATLRSGILPDDLEPAISAETKRLATEIDSLRNRRSPASLVQERVRAKELPERAYDALAAAKILTAQVAMHFDRASRDKLFQQLDSLHDISEWEEGDEPVRQASFATFLKAILSLRPQRRPGLGLSHDGNLVAAWTSGRDRLTIEFLQNDRVRWVLARYLDDEPDRYAGQTPVTRLAEGLKPYQPEHWFLK